MITCLNANDIFNLYNLLYGEAQHSTNIQGCLTASPPMRAAPTCAIKVTSNNIN